MGAYGGERLTGIGLVVAHAETGKVWINRDRKSKPVTGRRAGDYTIPFETRKLGESSNANVLGALPELFDDETLPRNNLFTTDNLQSTEVLTFPHGETLIDYSLAVVIYNGPKEVSFRPYDELEASPVGWKSPQEVLAKNKVRLLARHALVFLGENNVIEQKMDEFRNTHKRAPVVGPDFIISQQYAMREQGQDMMPTRAYPMRVSA